MQNYAKTLKGSVLFEVFFKLTINRKLFYAVCRTAELLCFQVLGLNQKWKRRKSLMEFLGIFILAC